MKECEFNAVLRKKKKDQCNKKRKTTSSSFYFFPLILSPLFSETDSSLGVDCRFL